MGFITPSVPFAERRKITMKGIKVEKGLLSLEACISVTIFLFFMLFLYSFFIIFEVRNEMAHVLLSATNSLSLDTYVNDEVYKPSNISSVIMKFYNISVSNDNNFISSELKKNTEDEEVESLVKERFIAYLADGNEDEANEILERYHIVGGIEGLNFSNSCIKSDGKSKNLYTSVSYSIEPEFNLWGLVNMEFEQSACSKLW